MLTAPGADHTHRKIHWHFCFKTSYRIFLDEKYCIPHFYHQTTARSHESLLLHFQIKTRPRRWCNQQSQVGAACGLLCYHHPAEFMLQPGDPRSPAQAWRTCHVCSTAQHSSASAASLTLWCTIVFWLGLLQPQRGRSARGFRFRFPALGIS